MENLQGARENWIKRRMRHDNCRHCMEDGFCKVNCDRAEMRLPCRQAFLSLAGSYSVRGHSKSPPQSQSINNIIVLRLATVASLPIYEVRIITLALD